MCTTNSSGVGAVGNQFGIVRKKHEFRIDAFSGKVLGRDLFASDVALDSQIAPLVEQLSHFNNERSVTEMRELLAVWIDFRDERAVNIKLEMIAIGADHRLRESDGCVSPRPVKRGFQHDLVGGIALRFVESGGGLWIAENIGDAVIADSVAGAEIRVRVVIEGAPADAARILRSSEAS